MEKTAIEEGRLDVVLSSLFSLSRSKAKEAIKNGRVRVNSSLCLQPSFKVKAFDFVSYEEESQECSDILSPKEKILLNYVYRDDDIAIIDKPRSLVVHPAAGHKDDTLLNQLIDEDFFEFDRSLKRPGIVHRIDKDTSGLLAVALNEESMEVLSSEVQAGIFERKYLALVHGNCKDKRFLVDAPLTKPNHTVRKAVVDIEKGREAKTHFTTLANNGEYSLLLCQLETGRTHQIRAHLAYLGYPIVGDSLYGRKDEGQNGQALHAFSLSLIHPRTLKRCTYYSPLDNYMKDLLIRAFRKRKK